MQIDDGPERAAVAQAELDSTAKLVESRAVPAVEFENAHIK